MVDVITILVALVFLVLAIAVGLRARRTGQESPRRLAWWLLTPALVAGSASLLGLAVTWPGITTLLVGFALYPVLLLRFGATLRADPSPLERLAVGVLLVEAGGAAVALGVVGGDAVLRVIFFGFAAFALVAHVVVQVVLAGQIRTMASSFVRRRAIVLSTGLLVLAGSLVLGVFAPMESGGLLSLVGAGVSGALLGAGAAPPRALMGAFLLPDYDQLMSAEERLTTAPQVADGAEDLLDALRRLYAARAAWLRYEGELLASVGGGPDDFAVAARSRRADDHGPRQVTDAEGHALWLLRAEQSSCELVIVAGREPVLYGLDIANLLPRTARRVAIAIEGRRLEERRRAQHQAEQEAEHYRRVAELKDDLLSTINHELRTPLQTVSGALELVTARWEQVADGQRRLLVERAEHNARALTQVVLEVLALVELRTGVTRPAPVRTPLRDMVAQALDPLDDDGRIEVVCPTAEAVLDPLLVGRVLRQLVDNALTHTDAPVRVEVGCDDDEVRLAVHDAGPGVPDHLLAPFERGGNYLHRPSRGLGLGLSLVVETVQLLGGQLRFDNDGVGAAATCRLPHAGATPGSTSSTSPSQTSSHSATSP